MGIASLFDAKIGAITFLSLGGNKLTEDEIEKIKEKNQNTLITNYWWFMSLWNMIILFEVKNGWIELKCFGSVGEVL